MKFYVYAVLAGEYADGTVGVVAQSEEHAIQLILKDAEDRDTYFEKEYGYSGSHHSEDFCIGRLGQETQSGPNWKAKSKDREVLSNKIFRYESYWWGLVYVSEVEDNNPRFVFETFHDG